MRWGDGGGVVLSSIGSPLDHDANSQCVTKLGQPAHFMNACSCPVIAQLADYCNAIALV